MSRLSLLVYLTAVIVTTVTPNVTGISCYHYAMLEGIQVENQTAPTALNDCLSCSKLTMVVNSPSVQYKMYQWRCDNDTFSGLVGNMANQEAAIAGSACVTGVTAVTYNNGSMFSMSCSCCDDFCNGVPSFCTVQGSLTSCVGIEVPPAIFNQIIIQISGGTNNTTAVHVNDVTNGISVTTVSAESISATDGTPTTIPPAEVVFATEAIATTTCKCGATDVVAYRFLVISTALFIVFSAVFSF